MTQARALSIEADALLTRLSKPAILQIKQTLVSLIWSFFRQDKTVELLILDSWVMLDYILQNVI